MLTLSRGAAGSRIIGIGHYQPARVLTNDELSRMVDTSDEWIRTRTGIETRHIAADDEKLPDLAREAARAAIHDAGVALADIDAVFVASTSVSDRSPNTAGRVSAALGLVSPAIVDVNVACSGFEHALALADHAIRAGSARTALVIGAERLSGITDWTDRSTCVLTADGAGAFVVQATDEPEIGPVAWGSVPSLVSAVRVEEPTNTFAQEGRSVFRWAISEAADAARRAVEASGLSIDDIQVFVPHQANLRIIEPLTEQLGFGDRVVVTDIVESGNTSAASIPMGLSKWWHAGRIPAGVPALLFGFGGGFAYAGQVVMTPTR
jgi:3-oxoacyl-[acyl-carrier-protein] synthase-3